MLTRSLARIAATVVLLGAGLVTMASPAQAQQVACGSDGAGGQICFLVVRVNTGGGWGVEVRHESGGETLPYCIRPATGNYVTCEGMYGWYNAESDCYIRHGEGMTPGESMLGYDEHGDDGVVYMGVCFGDVAAPTLERDGLTFDILPPHTGQPIVLGAGTPEGYGGTPSPLPGLIEEAINSLEMSGADIVIAPSPDGFGLIRLPVWLATTVSEQTWGPQSERAPDAGDVAGIFVTAEAAAHSIDWDLGNGASVSCDNPGTPYDDSYGTQESPTCGYPGYGLPSSEVGGRYPITATTNWVVTWEANIGASGELEVTTGSETSVLIRELQVLTTFE